MTYEVRQEKDKWHIFRPDGSKVNNIPFESERAASAYLDRLVSMGYCDKRT